jgi:hypothetical protein
LCLKFRALLSFIVSDDLDFVELYFHRLA